MAGYGRISARTYTPGTAETHEEIQLKKTTPFDKKLEVFRNTIKHNTWLNDVANFTRYEDDPNHEVGYKRAVGILTDNKLPFTTENIKRLRETISDEEVSDVIDNITLKSFMKESAYKYLSNTQQMTAQVIGAGIGPEVVLSAGLGIGLKANTIRQALSVTVPFETVATAGKLATDVGYDNVDAALDLGLGPVFEAAFIKLFTPSEASKIIEDNPVPTESQLLLPAPKAELPPPEADTEDVDFFDLAQQREARENAQVQAEGMDWYKEKQRELQLEKDKLDEFYGQPKVTGKDRKEADAIAKQREIEAQERQKSIADKEAEFEAEFQKLVDEEAMELRNKKELDDMLHRFATDPKYAPEPDYDGATIGSILRNVAKESKEKEALAKKSRLKSEKIVEIKESIKVLEDRIKDLEAKIKKGSSKSHMSRWAKDIESFKNKIKAENNKLMADIGANKKNKKAKELRRLGRMIGSSASDIQDVADSLKATLKSLSKEEAQELRQSIDLLHKQYPDTFDSAKSDLMNILSPKKNYTSKAYGKMSLKQKTMIAGLLGASGLHADSEDSEDMIDIIGLVMLASLGIGAYKGLGEAGGIKKLKQSISEVGPTLKQSLDYSEFSTSESGNKLRNVVDNMVTAASTRLSETYMPLAKLGGEIKSFVDDMLFSFEHGKYSAEIEKRDLVDRAKAKYNEARERNFAAWLDDNKIPVKTRVLDNMRLRDEFEKEIANAVEKGSSNKYLSAMAKITKEAMDTAYEYAVKHKVLGADSIKKINGYFPRIWNRSNLHSYMAMNKENRTKIINAIANSIVEQGEKSLNTAIEDATRIVDTATMGKRDSSHYESIFGKLEDLLKEGVSEEAVANRLNAYADRVNRLKGRIDLDIDKLDGIELIDGNGNKFTINKENLVYRDNGHVLEQHLNALYGQGVLAKRGYKTKAQAMNHIEKIAGHDIAAKEDLEDIVRIILGEPVHNDSMKTTNVVNTILDGVISLKLAGVAFSTGVELAKALFVRGPKGFFSTVSFATSNKNDLLVKALQGEVPLGVSRKLNKGDFRGYDGMDMAESVNDKGTIAKIAHNSKMATILFSQLSRISDFVQTVNLVTHTELLAEFLISGKGLSSTRLKGYGIDAKSISLLKGKFKFKDGNVQAPDFKEWTEAERDAYHNIMSRMNEEMSLTDTIGTSPLWARRSGAGRLATSLLRYTIQLISKQGARDLRNVDTFAALNNIFTFIGAYIGLQARYAVQNKNIDDEKLLYYALMNLPVFQPYSLIQGMADPAPTQITKEIADMVKVGF